MSTIRETVIAAGAFTSGETLDMIVNPLEERESMIVENLRSYGVGRGIPQDEVNRILEGAGLIESEPPVEEEPVVAGEQLADVARRIEEHVARQTHRLDDLAGTNARLISRIERLERHLGL